MANHLHNDLLALEKRLLYLGTQVKQRRHRPADALLDLGAQICLLYTSPSPRDS